MVRKVWMSMAALLVMTSIALADDAIRGAGSKITGSAYDFGRAAYRAPMLYAAPVQAPAPVAQADPAPAPPVAQAPAPPAAPQAPAVAQAPQQRQSFSLEPSAAPAAPAPMMYRAPISSGRWNPGAADKIRGLSYR